MIPILVKLAKSRAAWGVTVSLGLLLAVVAHGKLKFASGRAVGIASERAAWSSEVALARASATSSQVAADAATSALRDTVATLRDSTAVLSEAAALARGDYRAALAAYRRTTAARADSGIVTAEQQSCDELARTCAASVAASVLERAALTRTLATATRLVAVQDSVIGGEPRRTTLSNQEAMAAQRAAFKAPSRAKWAGLGAALGGVIAWGVLR